MLHLGKTYAGIVLKLATLGLALQSNNHFYEPKDEFPRLFLPDF